MDIGIFAGGLAQGLQAGYGIANQQLETQQRQQAIDIEKQKSDIQLKQWQSSLDASKAFADAMGPVQQQQTQDNQLYSMLANASDLAKSDPSIRKTQLPTFVASFKQMTGKDLAPNVVDAFKSGDGETLAALIDKATHTALSGNASPAQIVQLLSDPGASWKWLASQGAAVATEAGSPIPTAPNPLQTQIAILNKKTDYWNQAADNLRQNLPRMAMNPTVMNQAISQIGKFQTLAQQNMWKVAELQKPVSLIKDAVLTVPTTGQVTATNPGDPNEKLKSPAVVAQELALDSAKFSNHEKIREDAATTLQNRLFPSTAPPDATGEEYLASLPPGQANDLRAIVEGRKPAPSTRSGTPAAIAYNAAIGRADPTYDATLYPARNAMRRDYSNERPTAPGGQIRSANTLIQHFGDLTDAYSALQNSDVPRLNAIANQWNVEIGKSPQITYQNIGSRIAEESTKYYRGAVGAEQDVQRGINLFANPNASPAAARDNVKASINALVGVLDPLKNAWETTMGPTARAPQWLDARSQKALAKIEAFTGSTADMAQFKQPSAVASTTPSPANNPNIPTITGDADYAKLPKGALFIGPDGKRRVKP